MSRSVKGRSVRTIIKKILQKQGYSVFLFKHTKYGPNDCFGTDLVAMNGKEIVFVQTTADTGVGRKLEELSKYPYPDHVKRQVWRYIGGRRRKVGNKETVNQRIYVYDHTGKKIDDIDLHDYKDVLQPKKKERE